MHLGGWMALTCPQPPPPCFLTPTRFLPCPKHLTRPWEGPWKAPNRAQPRLLVAHGCFPTGATSTRVPATVAQVLASPDGILKGLSNALGCNAIRAHMGKI